MKPAIESTVFGLMLLTCVLVSGVVFPVLGQAAEPGTAADRSAQQAVRAASALEVQAFLHRDAKQLAGLWSDTMVVTNPLNKFVSKRQVLDMVQSGVLTFSAYDRAIEYARVYGDTVILAGNETVTWGNRMPHAGQTEHLLFTAVWMRQAGRWQEVARHANVVPSA